MLRSLAEARERFERGDQGVALGRTPQDGDDGWRADDDHASPLKSS